MTGVVLCGGQSSRMRTDKGLIQQSNSTWSHIAFSKLSSLNIPVVVSVNKQQENEYSKFFSGNNLIADDEALLIRGPLLGLLSVHKNIPDEDLVVLACDMIDMKEQVIENLIAHKDQFHAAYVYEDEGNCQPLCGMYTSTGLKSLFQLYHQKKLKKFSMMYALECIDTKYIAADREFIECFVNYNSAEDLSIKINLIS